MKSLLKVVTLGVLVATALAVGCGAGSKQSSVSRPSRKAPETADAGSGNDDSRCDYRGKADREAVETAGPGAVQPNVRRVYQIVGGGDSAHKVLVCREMDTNLDGLKDIVRFYNEKGDSLREEADTNFDRRIDTWTIFAAGRIGKEEIDTNHDGRADVWKYYTGGQLARVQRDTNFDGRPDRWEFYVNGRLERSGVDVDFDGHVDRWDHDEAVRLAEDAAESDKQGAASTAGADAGPGAPDAGPVSKTRSKAH